MVHEGVCSPLTRDQFCNLTANILWIISRFYMFLFIIHTFFHLVIFVYCLNLFCCVNKLWHLFLVSLVSHYLHTIHPSNHSASSRFTWNTFINTMPMEWFSEYETVCVVIYLLSRQTVRTQLRPATSTSLLAVQMVLWECSTLPHSTSSLLCPLHTTWGLMLLPNSRQSMYLSLTFLLSYEYYSLQPA